MIFLFGCGHKGTELPCIQDFIYHLYLKSACAIRSITYNIASPICPTKRSNIDSQGSPKNNPARGGTEFALIFGSDLAISIEQNPAESGII